MATVATGSSKDAGALRGCAERLPGQELAAIEAIVAGRGDELVAATVKDIAVQTGRPVQTVQRRLRLRLSPQRSGVRSRSLTATVAEAAARLTAEQQAVLERALLRRTRLTLQRIRELTRESRERRRCSRIDDEAY
jgi:hypothetical protein